jgi:hypothetical protein
MTTESAYAGDDPRRLLSSARELARRVRKAQHATWTPLLVFAAVTFASIPVSRYSGHHAGTCAAVPEGRICAAYSTEVFVSRFTVKIPLTTCGLDPLLTIWARAGRSGSLMQVRSL